MSHENEGLIQSLQDRLVHHAKETNVDPNLIFNRFAIERFLYRVSRSPHADRFVLKGGLLMLVWLGESIRPTRDVDFLGFGDLTTESLASTFGEICSIAVEDDGMTYDAASIRVSDIRPEEEYGGRRVLLGANLGSTKMRIQVDVGFGDTVDPAPIWIDYPSLLDSPTPHLRCYPPEVLIAEKLHAMVIFGARNSRMRDFFDIHALSRAQRFAGPRLTQAIQATFEGRKTPIPETTPIALTPHFSEEDGKRAQWRAFLSKNRIDHSEAELDAVIRDLGEFLSQPLSAAHQKRTFTLSWAAGGPWRD